VTITLAGRFCGYNCDMSVVTRILSQIDSGDPAAAEQLLPLVYDELRKLAAAKLAQEQPDQTLQATALVHEAYLRLVGQEGQQSSWDNRGHFFAAAAEAMRRILVETARRKRSSKHGGDLARHDVADVLVAAPEIGEDLLALDDALDRLAEKDPLKADLVKLRHFAGLTIDEAAHALGISTTTANRYWANARAWLHQEIAGHRSCPDHPRTTGARGPRRQSWLCQPENLLG
jgi:RNA polymerase sigma factor (TIGR02999 family)